MQNKIDSESESENEVVVSTIMSRKALNTSLVTKLEIPVTVQQVISKIEQAQLFRAREDITTQLSAIMQSVQRITNRYAAADNMPSRRKISFAEYKKRRINLLEKIATHANSAETREKILVHILAWLEKWNAILSEMTEIDIDEHHHWIAQLEILPETFRTIENNVKVLMRISSSLLEEKKKQKKKLSFRGILWKSWKERVIKRPATAHALRPDQMISDEFATNIKVSEIQGMLQELIGTTIFNKLENNAIKYISSTMVNLSKALSILNNEVKLINFESANMYINETNEREKELSLKIIQDLSEKNEMLQQKLQDAREKYEQLIRSKVSTASPTSTLKIFSESSPQSSVATSKADKEDSIDSILAKQLENIVDEAQRKGTKASGIKWNSAISYTAQVEMTPDLIEQQSPSKDISEDEILLKKSDVYQKDGTDKYHSQKKKLTEESYVRKTSVSNLREDKSKQTVSESKADYHFELQEQEKKSKERKSFSEAKSKSSTQSKGQYVPADFPSTDTKSQGGKSTTSSPWEQASKLKPEYVLEDISVITNKFKSHELVKSQARITKETSESTRALGSSDGESEESYLEEFQKAIMAFLEEKIDHIGKPSDEKTEPEKELLLKKAEVEKLGIIKAKMEVYFQNVAETVTKILRKYKDIKYAEQVEEEPTKQKTVASYMPGLHFQKPISAKSKISTLLSDESMDPVIHNLIQTILTEIGSERDAPLVSIAGKDHTEIEKQRQEEYLQEGQEKKNDMNPKHQLEEERNLWKHYGMISKNLEQEKAQFQMKVGKQEQQKQNQWQEEVWKKQQIQRIQKQIEEDEKQKQMEEKEEEQQKQTQQQLKAWEQKTKEQVPLKKKGKQMRQIQKEVKNLELESSWEKEEKQKPMRNAEHEKQWKRKGKDQMKIIEENSKELNKMFTHTSVVLSPRRKSTWKDASQLHKREELHVNLKTLESPADEKHPMPITPPTSKQSSLPGPLPIFGQSPTKSIAVPAGVAQALGITVIPKQAVAQAQAEAQAQAQAQGIIFTPQQDQTFGVTATLQQAQALGVTLTPQQAQAHGITLTPEEAQEYGVTLIPQQVQALGVTVTPQQAQAHGVTVTPQQAQALGVTLTPQQAQALGVTLTPQQAQALGVTLTPQQAQALGVTLTPQQAQALGVTLTPQQAQALGVTLTPQQAQGITLTTEQFKTLVVALTPEKLQGLGVTLTHEQVQALRSPSTLEQDWTLRGPITPNQGQALKASVTSEQTWVMQQPATTQQAQITGIPITQRQDEALGVTITPQQTQALQDLLPKKAQALMFTLSPEKVQILGIPSTHAQAQAVDITLTPEQEQASGVPLTLDQAHALETSRTAKQAWKLGASITPEMVQEVSNILTFKQNQALAVTPSHEQAQAFGTPFTLNQAQALGVPTIPPNAWKSAVTLTPKQTEALGAPLTSDKAHALGFPLTPEQAQLLGAPFTPGQAQPMDITHMSEQDLKPRALAINEQPSQLWTDSPLGHTLNVGIFSITDKSIKPSAPHIPKQPLILAPSTIIPFQESESEVSLPLRQPITSRTRQSLASSAPITDKSSTFEVSSAPLQISRSPLNQALFVPGKSLDMEIPSDPRKLLAPQTFPSPEETLASKSQSTPVQFLTPEVPPTTRKLPISGVPLTLGQQPLALDSLLSSRQSLISRDSLTPQSGLISEAPLAPRQPLISGVPPATSQIPTLWNLLSPRKPLVPGASSIPGELMESGPLTLSERSKAFQPSATFEKSPYQQAPSSLGHNLAPWTLPGQASPLWISPTPGHPPTLWAPSTLGKNQKDLSSSVSKTTKESLTAISSLKSKSALVHPSAPHFKVPQTPFTTKKFQTPEVSDASEEIRTLCDSFAMEQFRTFQSSLTNYRTPVSQTPYIDEGALPTLMKTMTLLPSLTTQLPKTSQISSSERDQKSQFPPINKPCILTSVSGTKKPKMMVPPSSPQELKEQKYFVDVAAQRKNLILLNQATKTSRLPSELHTTARNLVIETLHTDTIRLGYLFRKYIAYRLIQCARNNIIKQLQTIQNSGKGYEIQNLYIMLNRIDDYQKKVMGVWTKKQKSLEQKRNQCLRKMMFLFSQFQEMHKLDLGQPIPLLINKNQIPAVPTKFVQQPFLELPIEKNRRSDTFKKFRQEDHMEAIWNADQSTSSYPIAEKTSLHSLWAQLGGYPAIPMLLQLDVQSTFRKSLTSIQSQLKKIPK